jgi:multiple sugar transport system substrate-binding protein
MGAGNSHSVPRKGVSRREFLKLTGAGVAGAALLPACGGFSGGGEGGSSNTLIFSHGPEDTGALKALLDRFNKSHNYKVKWQVAPADTGAYFDKMRTELQAGTGPDVISGDVIWPAQFGSNGWVLDLSNMFTEQMASNFLPGPLQAVTWNGKRWAVPWFTDAGMMYYRKDLLSKSGFGSPPKTYDELMSMAKKIATDSGVKFGDVFQGDRYEGGVCDGLEFIWGADGNVLSPTNPNKVVISSPQSVTGLATERSLITKGVAPSAVASYQEQQSQVAFTTGQSVFMRNWPYIVGLIQAGGAGIKIKFDQVAVAALPTSGQGTTGYSCLGGWNLFINANIASNKKGKAWEFIKYMASPQATKFRAIKGNYLPPLKNLYNDPEVLKKVQTVALAKQLANQIRPRPVSPFYSDMSLDMQETFNDLVKGDTSPQQAVSTLQGNIQGILKRGA